MSNEIKVESAELIPTAEILEKQIKLAEIKRSTNPEWCQLEAVRLAEDNKFALTPVGQELKRFEIFQRMGQMYAMSTIIPDTYKKNVANCAIAVDMAFRMHANPVMVMQNLYIVHGNPSWSSKFLIATINTCGRYKTLKYRRYQDGMIGKVDYFENEWNYENGKSVKKRVKKTFDGSKIPNIVCVAYTSEIGSDEILESTSVSCRMAVEEGWWTKNESKWPTMTELMLTYRSAAFWQRMYAPEISMGFYTVEELEDMGEYAAANLIEAPKTVKGILKSKAFERALEIQANKEPAETQAESTVVGQQPTEEVAESQEKQGADPSIAAHKQMVQDALNRNFSKKTGIDADPETGELFNK